MLSERERQMLHQMEMGLSCTDPRFVAAMRLGRPRAPREYRRTALGLLMLLGFLAFVAVIATGHPLALIALLAIAVTSLFRFVSRQLDQA
jgi:Protein of unknown function (DUF3040)